MRRDPHFAELSGEDARALDDAHPYAIERFSHYRRLGYRYLTALRFALAWGRNVTEQRQRRVAHDTGAQH